MAEDRAKQAVAELESAIAALNDAKAGFPLSYSQKIKLEQLEHDVSAARAKAEPAAADNLKRQIAGEREARRAVETLEAKMLRSANNTVTAPDISAQGAIEDWVRLGRLLEQWREAGQHLVTARQLNRQLNERAHDTALGRVDAARDALVRAQNSPDYAKNLPAATRRVRSAAGAYLAASRAATLVVKDHPDSKDEVSSHLNLARREVAWAKTIVP